MTGQTNKQTPKGSKAYWKMRGSPWQPGGTSAALQGAGRALVPPQPGSQRRPKAELPLACFVSAEPRLGALPKERGARFPAAAAPAEHRGGHTEPVPVPPGPVCSRPWALPPGEAMSFAGASSRHCPVGRWQSSSRPGGAKETTGLAKEGTTMDGWAGISLKILSFSQKGSATCFPCSRLRTSMYLSESGTLINNAGFCL